MAAYAYATNTLPNNADACWIVLDVAPWMSFKATYYSFGIRHFTSASGVSYWWTEVLKWKLQ